MKAKSLFVALLVLTYHIGQSQVRYGGELKITNADGLYHNFKLQAIGMVWGPSDQDYPVTHEWDSYILNNSMGLIVDHCGSPEPSGDPKIGYGRYKLTVETGYVSRYIYVDFRDCDYLDGSGPCCGTNYIDPDIEIYFDSRLPYPFYYYESGNPNPISLNLGSTFPIWHRTNKNPSTQNKTCFGPTVTISGPTSLPPGQSGTFTAVASGINLPLSYQWYRRIECIDLDKEPDGTKDTPCGKWYAFGGNTNTVQSSAWQDFSLKCVVTDAAYNTAYDTHYIHVSSDDFKEKIIIQNNYPNPFNSTTLISFELLQPSSISLIIFNVHGQSIKTLVSDELAEGQHQILWDGTDDTGNFVSTGIYLCQFLSEQNSQFMKLFLIK
jgi:hypothetical protein